MSMLKGFPILVSCLSLIAAAGCDESVDRESDTVPTDILADALDGIEVADGFMVELVASEPLISDPVDIEIDEYGRLYVLEMPGYPLDTSGSGTVKLLSDSTGNGRLDTSVVFADGLTLPTGIMRWKAGVLVVDTPNVLYFEDTDGDGKADKREVILSGFALSNPQHNVNNPELGLDNWIYLGHEPAVTTKAFDKEFGDKGSAIHFADSAHSPRLPVNAAGRSVRFRPDSKELELLASRTQFGHSFTAWGHRLTVNNNNHVMHEVMAARYLDRNPYLPVASATQSLSDHGDAARVFPITTNPEHQLLTDVGVITSASGITVYLGGAFGEEYAGSVFVAEPVSNLVHADKLRDAGASFVASRMIEGSEFLASKDAWFRPVNLYVGPDGGLYVVDYYRRIIEHPEWMADEAIASGNLYEGRGMGRIYRIMPKGSRSATWFDSLKLGDASVVELIATLANENIWWRRHAQRLLVDRLSGRVVSQNVLEALEAMARNVDSSFGRLHALWTLEGIGRLRPEVIKAAIHDPESGVRENAIRLAELHLENAPDLGEVLVQLNNEPNARVRFQLLLTLGYIDTPEAAALRQTLLFSDLSNQWMQIAALSAPPALNRGILDVAITQFFSLPASSELMELIQRLAAMEAATEGEERLLQLLMLATDPKTDEAWQASLLEGLAASYRKNSFTPNTVERAQARLLRAAFSHPSVEVRHSSLTLLQAMPESDALRDGALIEEARQLANDANAAEQERLAAIRFLALADAEGQQALFRSLMKKSEPLQVQLGALDALGTIDGASVATFLIGEWPRLTPEIRDNAIDLFLKTPAGMSVLLDALEAGKVQTGSIGWRRSVRLMGQKDEALRRRARELLATSKEGSRSQVVEAYQPALTLDGSAENGEQIYQRQCASCHQLGEDKGDTFGPDLATLRNRQPANILADILDPNRSIADGYDLWMVSREDGSSIQGILASETAGAISLRQVSGQEVVIGRKDISAMTMMNMSSMPEGLENAITLQQMADLLAFIRESD